MHGGFFILKSDGRGKQRSKVKWSDVFAFVLLYTNKVILVRVQMDIWEKCNSYVQLKNEKWMYGEKVMENVLFYLAHWIYRKFFNNYVLLHEKKWTLIERFFIYVQKLKKYRIYEKIFFAYVHDTFEFTIFTVYVEKKKWNYLK